MDGHKKSGNCGKSEGEIKREILLTYGSHNRVMLVNNPCGVFQKRVGKKTYTIRVGRPGQADIIGILSPEGTFLAIETKSATGPQRSKQKTYQNVVEKFGGIYILARSVDDVRARLGF